MRDPNRLYNFYNELQCIHMKHPHMRFGQLVYNFTKWLDDTKNIDIFYLEENDLLTLFKEYMKEA